MTDLLRVLWGNHLIVLLLLFYYGYFNRFFARHSIKGVFHNFGTLLFWLCCFLNERFTDEEMFGIKRDNRSS